jgi:1-acyl-sn-glycerol-3-phosphate acyltransferase
VALRPEAAGTNRRAPDEHAGRPWAATWAAFEPDPRRSVNYRLARVVFLAVTRAWFRPVVRGSEHVPAEGPVIIAPVHRSFADFAFTGLLTRRKLFFMAKDDLWRRRALGRLMLALGAFPVHRDGADREALRRAQAVLERGQALVLFPEGTRQQGAEVAELHEGAAFLAARARAPIVPVGIGGSEASMPKGARIPKRLRIQVVVGPPIPPAVSASGRVPRSALRDTTDQLRDGIQRAYDDARAAFDGR